MLVISFAVTDAQLKGMEDMFWLMVSACGLRVPLLWACGEGEHRESRILWGSKHHDGSSTPRSFLQLQPTSHSAPSDLEPVTDSLICG